MNHPLISLPELLQSIRQAGYRSTAHAVAELIDNSIQAGAQTITCQVDDGPDGGPEIEVVDDGHGIPPDLLPLALSLGGSTRYGDRAGLGRFGVGLPCASLSQARRVEVISWTAAGAFACALDLDEVQRGARELRVAPTARPPSPSPSGTRVRWSRTDLLRGQRAKRVAQDLRVALGRTFRRFIWEGLRLLVNGEPCPPADPTLLDPRAPWSGASRYGEPLEIEIATSLGAGQARVTFSELPVTAWHGLPMAEKRARGITRGAGVSVVRARREIEHGWLLMGEKRKEAYDDWWRCEVELSPSLDEAAGLTFTKQQIRPSPELIEALEPILVPTAHALNARARRAHEALAARARVSATEALAERVAGRLPPLPPATAEDPSPLLRRLAALHPELLGPATGEQIRLIEEDLGDLPLFEPLRWGPRLIVAVNRSHPFYSALYGPLVGLQDASAAAHRAQWEVLLVSLARAEATGGASAAQLAEHRRRWSDALTELLRG
jgi:hypothetical protein